MEAIQKMRPEKESGPSEASVKIIITRGKIEVKVIMNMCQRVLNSRRMRNEQNTCVIVPIFKACPENSP